MSASTELWNKYRRAQKIKAGDAAYAYQHAIEHANKGKTANAEWWERQGDLAMPVEKRVEEHATR
jgi:hypothetical protein